MGGGKGTGKGKGAAKNKPVIKDMDKQVEVKMIEKRTDPSDGNGPFTHASFIRFHGPEKGQELWEEGANSAVMVEAKKKGKGKGKKRPSSQRVVSPEPQRQVNKSQGKMKKTEPVVEVKKQDDTKKSKGKGKKGTGTKGGQEKRVDPSDGNGPFTKASFIRFHGDDKGLQLWNQAGKAAGGGKGAPAMKSGSPAKNPFNFFLTSSLRLSCSDINMICDFVEKTVGKMTITSKNP
ncbi:unnamed protein product [Amoebophrya sp. A25]|nr:unnamed protein product [Amoebophrya sp. A25]|eukprot:GSA25T00012688001.1